MMISLHVKGITAVNQLGILMIHQKAGYTNACHMRTLSLESHVLRC